MGKKELEIALPILENFFEYYSKCCPAIEKESEQTIDEKKTSLVNLQINLNAKEGSKDASCQLKQLSLAQRRLIVEQGQSCLKKAREALKNEDDEVGWAHYNCAESLRYLLLNENELQVAAKEVFGNSDALDDCEKAIVRSLIGKAEGGKWSCKENCRVHEVSSAANVLHRHNLNRHTHLRLAQKPLYALLVSAMILIGVIIYFMNYNPGISRMAQFSASGFNASIVNATGFNATSFIATNVNATDASYEPALNQTALLITVFAFGALGAVASGIITIGKDSLTGDIPKRLLNTSVMIARPIFGGLAGLAIYVFLISGLLEGITGTAITNPLVFAVCFAAGFSEKYFLGAIEKADQSGKEEK